MSNCSSQPRKSECNLLEIEQPFVVDSRLMCREGMHCPTLYDSTNFPKVREHSHSCPWTTQSSRCNTCLIWRKQNILLRLLRHTNRDRHQCDTGSHYHLRLWAGLFKRQKSSYRSKYGHKLNSWECIWCYLTTDLVSPYSQFQFDYWSNRQIRRAQHWPHK